MLRWVTATNTIAWQYRYNCLEIKKQLLRNTNKLFGECKYNCKHNHKIFLHQSLSQTKQRGMLRALGDGSHILYFRQIHFTIWTNTLCNLDNYILQFGTGLKFLEYNICIGWSRAWNVEVVSDSCVQIPRIAEQRHLHRASVILFWVQWPMPPSPHGIFLNPYSKGKFKRAPKTQVEFRGHSAKIHTTGQRSVDPRKRILRERRYLWMGIIDQSPFHLDNVAMKAYKSCKKYQTLFYNRDARCKLNYFWHLWEFWNFWHL